MDEQEVLCTDVEVVDDWRIDSSSTDEQLLTCNTEHCSNMILTREVLHDTYIHKYTEIDTNYRLNVPRNSGESKILE